MCKLGYKEIHVMQRLADLGDGQMAKFQNALGGYGIRSTGEWVPSMGQMEGALIIGAPGMRLSVEAAALRPLVVKAGWARVRGGKKLTIAGFYHPQRDPSSLRPFWELCEAAVRKAGGSMCHCDGWNE
jgi:hypothetical protein